MDWQAYADVHNGLSLLVKPGHLDDAMSPALKLMKHESYQVECSDEGMMTDEIEECLKPVIRAFKAAGGDRAEKWASDMQAADRVLYRLCAENRYALPPDRPLTTTEGGHF